MMLVSSITYLKKKLSTDLRIIFPSYSTVFSSVTTNSSIAILSAYPTPQAILDAPKDKILEILISKSKKGLLWPEKNYTKLIESSNEACIIGLPSHGLAVKITSSINLIKALEKEINTLLNEIKVLINSVDFPESIKNNIDLIDSISGIGYLTAVTLIAEIGDIDGFIKPKHLVDFLGIDSSVNESGKFKGNQNKMSKRGPRIGRRALYAVAIASIRKNRIGVPINEVLLNYYQINLNGKKAKVALGAIMHKILNYIFAILRNQTPFEVRDPRIHK